MTVDPDGTPTFVKLQLAAVGRLAVHIGPLDSARRPVGDLFLGAVRAAVVPEHGEIVKTSFLGGFHGTPSCLMRDGTRVVFRGTLTLNLGKYKAVEGV